MKKCIVGAFLLTGLVLAQTTDVKPRAPKTKKEAEILDTVFKAPDAASRMSAVDSFLSQFADTQFKALALYIATVSAEEAGNWEKTVIYGDRALEADPKSYGTMLVLARGYAGHTREFDLDKEEKLGKTDSYAKSSLDLLKNAPKIQPQIPDDQWAAQVQSFVSEAHEAMGLAATIRKKYDESVTHFQAALVATPGNANLLTRIAQSNFDAKKYDEAIKSADAVLTLPNLHPTVKNIAESIKQRATAAKSNK